MDDPSVIVVVGCGAAGVAAAEGLHERGYDGEVLILGCEPPFERPALSKEFLRDPDMQLPPGTAPNVGSNVEIDPNAHVAQVDALGRTVTTASDKRIGYDRLLLATGAEPRRLRVRGADAEGVYYLRDLAQADVLRTVLVQGSTLLIVGGGVIGLEVAASASSLGVAVTVLELADQLMGRVVARGCSDLIEALHSEHGVTIQTAAKLVRFETVGGRVVGARLADERFIASDAVLVGIGALPRMELASRAGIDVASGVLVNAQLQSSAAGVFAAGDVAEVFHLREGRSIRMEQWRNAQEQGRVAAGNMLGDQLPYLGIPSMWSDQYNLHLQSVGFGFEGTKVVQRGELGDRGGCVFFGLQGERLVAACGMAFGTGAARTVRAAERLITGRIGVSAECLRDPEFDLWSFARRFAANEWSGSDLGSKRKEEVV